MLTPLLAKLRRNHPNAEVHLTVSAAMLPLYATRPYGVIAHELDWRKPATVAALLQVGGFDLVILPAENRLSWLARALGARWIVAFAGEPGSYKNFPIDELRPFASQPKAWGEMVCELADGEEPSPYDPRDWPAPPYEPFDLPPQPYAVLHVGASSPLRYWPAEHWQEVADWLTERGLHVVWTCGPGQQALLQSMQPKPEHYTYAGNLDLAQFWNIISMATLMLSPETGVVHLAHLVDTRTTVLYGPGNPSLFGRGVFWGHHPEQVVFQPHFPCRDRNIIFRRPLPWGEFCGRGIRQCGEARCMKVLSVQSTLNQLALSLP